MTERRLRIGAFGALAIGALILGVWRLLAALTDPGIHSYRYATYSDLQGSGFSGGWLPDFLPASARSICEAHSVDFSDVCAAFVLEARSMNEFRADLRRRGFEEVAPGSERPPCWCASTDCPGERFCDDSAELFRGPDRQEGTPDVFAFDHGMNQVCYWAVLE